MNRSFAGNEIGADQEVENAGLEYERPNHKAWKCRTGKRRTKIPDLSQYVHWVTTASYNVS